MTTDTLAITLNGREYHVACKPEEQESLLEAVRFLDVRMGEIATQTRSSGERLAVMTALNLAHELLAAGRPATGVKVTDGAFDYSAFRRRIESMEARLDAVLDEQQEKLF